MDSHTQSAYHCWRKTATSVYVAVYLTYAWRFLAERLCGILMPRNKTRQNPRESLLRRSRVAAESMSRCVERVKCVTFICLAKYYTSQLATASTAQQMRWGENLSRTFNLMDVRGIFHLTGCSPPPRSPVITIYFQSIKLTCALCLSIQPGTRSPVHRNFSTRQSRFYEHSCDGPYVLWARAWACRTSNESRYNQWSDGQADACIKKEKKIF